MDNIGGWFGFLFAAIWIVVMFVAGILSLRAFIRLADAHKQIGQALGMFARKWPGENSGPARPPWTR